MGLTRLAASPPTPSPRAERGRRTRPRVLLITCSISFGSTAETFAKLPLEERQALLKKLPLKPPLHRVTGLKESAVADEKPWERAQREGWEGVIAKRRGSIYEPRRSPNWLKMKVELSQEFVVGGFTDPQGKRIGLGALLVGYYEYGPWERGRPRPHQPLDSADSRESGRPRPHGGSSATNRGTQLGSPAGVVDATGSSDNLLCVSVPRAVATGSTDDLASHPAADFIYAGKIGTGFNTKLLLDLRTQLDKIEIAKAPFTKAVGLPRLRAHWVRPKIVVQVGFIQWTKYGKLRHPRLLAIRDDKSPREVVRE